MSTRRRVGFNTATSEASRRQLMQPVPCWEKVWGPPDNAPPGTTLRVYKWVKTDKKQQFSDDEGELTDQPLAPLPEPEEIEVGDGDEEIDQDEAATSVAPETTPVSRDVSEPLVPKDESKPATPKPHPLSISFQPPTPTPGPEDALDDSLKPLEGVLGTDALDDSLTPLESGLGADALGADITLDMSQMGPDGEPFEAAQNTTQFQADDSLLGGALMDETIDDPFAMPPS